MQLNTNNQTSSTNTSSLLRLSSTQGDRFIPNRSAMNLDVSHFNILQNDVEEDLYDNSYKSYLANSLFGESKLEDCKILSLKNKAPKPVPQSFVDVLYTHNSGGSKKDYSRSIPTTAEKILDAPGLLDDYYLNLLDWSSRNVLSVALGGAIYLWNATTSNITELVNYENKHITSVNWSPNSPQYLAVGTSDAQIEIWDVDKGTQIRAMSGHSGRVSSLAWNNHILSSGSFDTSIRNNDLRIASPLISTFSRHIGEVCGLKWSLDGTQLASGGNDNLLNIWQFDTEGPKYCIEEHMAAVKALAWCPWQSNLLASGGGSADRTIKFWNTQTGICLNSIDTESQVCSIQWSKHRKELVSSHGFSKNQLCVWKYPSMTKLAELTGHSQRVMHLAMSPDGTTVVSGSADETLRFWRVFEPVSVGKMNSTKDIPRGIQSNIHKIR